VVAQVDTAGNCGTHLVAAQYSLVLQSPVLLQRGRQAVFEQ